MKTKGRAFYEAQVDYLVRNDVDGLVKNHYHKDAVVVGFDFVVRGEGELRPFFRQYLERLGSLTIESTDKFIETEDSIFFEATISTANLGRVHVFDVFVLRDGKITHHFAGTK